jgi:hypothetical protein
MAVKTEKKPYEVRREKWKKKREERKKKAKKYWEKRYGTGRKMTSKQEKEYSEMNKGELERAKRAMTSKKAYGTTFKSAFANARKEGKDKFTWQGKSYHTKTKSELEAKIAKAPDAVKKGQPASPAKKGNIFSKIATKMRSGHATQAGYEEARAKRIKEKRIAAMEKRKEEGKSYSAKRLAELKEGDTGSKKTWITKKEKKEKKGPWITKKPGRGWRKDVQIPGMKA